MKSRLLLIALLASFSAWGQTAFESYRQTSFESNFGFAYIGELEIPFPGCSFLIGNRKFYSENKFIDAQIGLAFPTIATAKIGVGKYNFDKGKAVIIGLRIWPTHIYIQQSVTTDRCSRTVNDRTLKRLKRRGKTRTNLLCGEWNYSIEVGVPALQILDVGIDFQDLEAVSAYSSALATIGYRIYFD